MIENGSLTGFLPIPVGGVEPALKLVDELNAFSKIELALSPLAQGGLELALTGHSSRSALNEVAENRPADEKTLLNAIAMLAKASLRLDLHDLFKLLQMTCKNVRRS